MSSDKRLLYELLRALSCDSTDKFGRATEETGAEPVVSSREHDDDTALSANTIPEDAFSSSFASSSFPRRSHADVGGLSYENELDGTTRNSGSRDEASTGAGTRINSECSLITVFTGKRKYKLQHLARFACLIPGFTLNVKPPVQEHGLLILKIIFELSK